VRTYLHIKAVAYSPTSSSIFAGEGQPVRKVTSRITLDEKP
jgi:hypothetical protein